MPDGPAIFICYAEPDRALAEALHAALAAVGLDPWCDAIDLQPGDRWSVAIPRALDGATMVAVLLTGCWPALGAPGPGYYDTEEVALAIRLARELGVRVVPVLFEGAGRERVPYGLNCVKALQARSDAIGSVARTLRELSDGVAPVAPAPRDPLDIALTRRDQLRRDGAPDDVVRSVEARILALKQARLHTRQPTAGLSLAGRWTLIEKLGRGGFAEVWKAWDTAAAEHVAVKILHAQFGDSAERRSRFFRGALRMARLEHPHVVRVIEAEVEHDGWLFFVMAFMAGGDLERAILDGTLAQDAALTAVCAVADALHVAHEQDMVHRDVKPSNILLDGQGCARLSDFDLIRAGDTTGGTRTGALGTFVYAAPEAMEDAGRATPQCDVFGLGMTAAFVCLGRITRGMVRHPERELDAAQVPPRLKQVILQAIDWDASQRHASALAFAEALRDAMENPQRAARRLVSGLALARRWTLADRLGGGEISEVWKAWDEAAREYVAVRILRAEFRDSAEQRTRFFGGAWETARLQRHGVVRIIEAQVESEGWSFFVMEFLPGGNLKQAIIHGALTPLDGVGALCTIAEALHAAHLRGCVYAGISPTDILLDADRQPKLGDLSPRRAGASELVDIIYIAPEAVEDPNLTTPASNIYGLGMTLAFVCLGVPLKRGFLRQPERFLGEAGVHPWLQLEIVRAISWEPGERHPDANAFASACRELLRRVGVNTLRRAADRQAVYHFIIELRSGGDDIRLVIVHPGGRIARPPRAHHELVWLLARAQARDASFSGADTGWITAEELLSQLGRQSAQVTYINVLVHRLRSQLAKALDGAGLPACPDFIVRESGRLRLGVRVEIHDLS